MEARITKFKQKLLGHKHIGLDTMCFIYQFAQDSRYSLLTHSIFELMEYKKILSTTSTISVIETFVLPEQHGDQLLLSEYEKIFLNLPGLTIIPIDWQVARLTARLRAEYPKIRIPDAIQLSAALLRGCKAFVTNDEQLRQIREIPVLLLRDYT